MKEWHVEDAGGGCRAFSEVLVLVCEETSEIFTTMLPLTWDDGFSFEEKACTQLTGLMEKAGVQKNDRLVVCSGNIFNTFHHWLSENGYFWDMGKIDGLAHDLAEYLFHTQAVKAGFPPELQLVERNYREYYSLIEKWVGAEPGRKIFWKDREVRRKPAETRYILKCNGGYSRSCQQCRQKIRPYSPVVVYRYRENGRRIRRYFHPACTPVTPLKSTLETLVVNWNSSKVEGVILNAKEEKRTCSICGQIIDPGARTFYGYNNDQLIVGHPACFKEEKDAVRGA
ncbi:MAG: hypothetical protein PHT62_05575 [Desulfotomaculaceae bacterium]|nr:hypothetical protein [Desulfotomaculaceae bacterium]